jgi:hypothetical protein
MSIELVYGFVEQNSSIHINEEELLVDYGVNLYSLKLSSGCATKACYGITPVLSSNLTDCGEIDLLNTNIKSFLRPEDIESIEKLYLLYKKNHDIEVDSLGLHIVYSTPLVFDSTPYSLRSAILFEELESNSDQNKSKLIDPLEKFYKQAQDHIEEQIQNQKRVIEYLEKLHQDSRYKFKLVHNLPGKDFLSEGKITIKYDLEIFEGDVLVHHVKIVSSGLYTISDGYVGSVKQSIVVSNNNFVPDEDFMGEFESWVYLYEDGSMFKDLTQPLDEYFNSLE